MSGFVVRFLTRRNCHLCDDARPIVAGAADRAGVPVREVDIDSVDELVALYGLRIPVVLSPSEEVLAEGVIEDERSVYRAIRRARRSAGE